MRIKYFVTEDRVEIHVGVCQYFVYRDDLDVITLKCIIKLQTQAYQEWELEVRHNMGVVLLKLNGTKRELEPLFDVLCEQRRLYRLKE